MMIQRWFKAVWPGSIWDLAEKIKTHPYDGSGDEGFLLDRVRNQSLEARFVERRTYDKCVIDPLGSEMVNAQIEFNQFLFRAYGEYPQLELMGPPKDSQAFVTRFAEINGFEVSLLPITVDVLRWSAAIENLCGTEFAIKSLSITDLHIKAGVRGAVTLKGTENIANALVMLRGKERLISKIEMLSVDKDVFRLVLSRSGVAMFDMGSSVFPIARMHETLKGLSS